MWASKGVGMYEPEQKTAITLKPGGGPTLTFMGMSLAYKVSGAETNGAWALLETVLAPNFSGMPLHWHEATQQSFYILEGKVTFQAGERVFLAEPGSFVNIPVQVSHTFCNQQNQPARLLEINVPSGLEDSFKELVAMNASEPALILKPHKLLDLYKRYDTFMSDEI
jgi:mannose-6-phosphate isomerase-like protein (cupin superfamily)